MALNFVMLMIRSQNIVLLLFNVFDLLANYYQILMPQQQEALAAQIDFTPLSS